MLTACDFCCALDVVCSMASVTVPHTIYFLLIHWDHNSDKSIINFLIHPLQQGTTVLNHQHCESH